MKRRLGDRRLRPRFEIVGDLWGTLDAMVGMPLFDVSPGGALIQSQVALAADSVHQVTLAYDGRETPISVRVRHVRRGAGADGNEAYFIGLEFLSVPVALQEEIRAWMAGGQSAANGV